MIAAFGRWSTEGISVEDPGLRRYICLEPRILPRLAGRHAGKRFHKSKVFIVERLINKLLVSGHKSKKHFRTSMRFTGMKAQATRAVFEALQEIEARTKTNPIAVLVRAIENAAPREDIVPIEYGGARYPKAVECSPQRRVDLALRWFAQGAYDKSFNSPKSIWQALADEIVNASKCDSRSYAIIRKLEVERQADASR